MKTCFSILLIIFVTFTVQAGGKGEVRHSSDSVAQDDCSQLVTILEDTETGLVHLQAFEADTYMPGTDDYFLTEAIITELLEAYLGQGYELQSFRTQTDGKGCSVDMRVIITQISSPGTVSIQN